MAAQGSGASNSSSGANEPEDSEEWDRTDKKRKTEEEHPRGLRQIRREVDGQGGKLKMRTNEESRLKKSIRCLKKLDNAEAIAEV